MSIQSFIQSEKDRFDEDFINKWFPANADIHTPDGDSRSMRERGSDFLTESHAKNLERLIGEMERMMSVSICSAHLKPDVLCRMCDRTEIWNAALTAVKDTLSKELELIRKI